MNTLHKTLTALTIAAVSTSAAVGLAAAEPLSYWITAHSGQVMTQTSVYAGSSDFGNEEGDVASASFRHPQALLALPDGLVLVADGKSQVIKSIRDGQVLTFAGLSLLTDELGFPEGGFIDGPVDEAAFNRPNGMAVDTKGNIYIADSQNHAIRKVTKSGSVTTVVGDGLIGSEDGTGTTARLYGPEDVAVAPDGSLYIADTLNHLIRKLATDGTVTTLNAPSERLIEIVPGIVEHVGDYMDGLLKDAKFNEPSGLAIDGKGNLYVSDTGNQRIRYIDFAKGTVVTVAGSSLAEGGNIYEENVPFAEGDFRDGDVDQALFNSPRGIALMPDGGLIVADSLNQAVRLIRGGTVTTLAGVPEQNGLTDGVGQFSLFKLPVDVEVKADGSILVADAYNYVIREIKPYRLPANLPNESVKVVYNDEAISFDTSPEIVNQRTMVPVRKIAEAIGFKVDYEAESKQIKMTRESTVIVFHIGSAMLTKTVGANEPEIRTLDSVPYVKQDRTYVPVRFFAEETGLDVQWISEQATAVLRDKVK